MKKQFITREYNFPDAELYTWSKERLAYARRDAQDFASYGVSSARLDAFETLIERFATLPSDDELVGEQMNATSRKYEAKEALKGAIRSLMLRVEQRYPAKSGHYRKFGTHKFNEMDDAKLLLCGLRVARVAERLLDFLQDTGLQQAHVDAVRQQTKAFENAIHAQQDKVADRDIAVERRVEVGNQVYQELVMVSNIGKEIWASKDRLKYEQYKLYESNNEQKKARKKRLAEAANSPQNQGDNKTEEQDPA